MKSNCLSISEKMFDRISRSWVAIGEAPELTKAYSVRIDATCTSPDAANSYIDQYQCDEHEIPRRNSTQNGFSVLPDVWRRIFTVGAIRLNFCHGIVVRDVGLSLDN